MAPNINNPGGVKNDPDEIRDGVVSDATRFPGGFIDQRLTDTAADVQIAGGYDVSSATFFQSFNVLPQGTQPLALTLKPDGSQLFISEEDSADIDQYDLSTNFDVSTASFTQSFDVSTQTGTPKGVDFRPDGSQMYVLGRAVNTVFQYNLSTGFDISTASIDQSFDVGAQESSPRSVHIQPNGSRLYVGGGQSEAVLEYSLSTAFDVSTATFTQSLSTSAQDQDPTGLFFSPDGTILVVCGGVSSIIFRYSLSTAFDVSTATFEDSLDVSPQDQNNLGVTFKPDGTHMYLVGESRDNVYQYGIGFLVSELG